MELIPPPSNANIKNNTNQIPKVGINRPSVISAIEPPVLRSMEVPVVRGLSVPIVDVPDTSIKYPVINVPTQAEFDAAVNAQKQQEQQPQQEKSRGLPDPTPQVPQVAQTPPTQTPIAEIPADKPTTPTFNVYGVNINLPDPSLVATAGAVAVVTTAATMASTAVLNVLKNAAEPFIKEATKNKFKIKIKQVKPVLHYVMAEGGHIDIFEYSSEGTRLVTQTSNVEQYIRDEVEKNVLYEIENKIIIDDVIKDKFTKEGQERFKPLYAPAKKIAKKLAARLSF
jgi:regulator of replication initiation timing